MPRYKTKIKMWLEVTLDAEDAAAAGKQAMSTILGINFAEALEKATPASFQVSLTGVTPDRTHLQVSYGPQESTEEVGILDYKGTLEPSTRLYQIFANCFKHGGPRIPMTPEMLADAKAAFKEIPEGPAKLAASASFSDYNVDLGDIKWPQAVFSGEWFADGETLSGGVQYGLGIRGYDSGHRWNGWACPEVTIEGARAIVKWQDSLSPDAKEGLGLMTIVPTNGFPELRVTDPSDPDVIDIVKAEPRETVDGPKWLYDISLGWCWEIPDPKTDHCCELVG